MAWTMATFFVVPLLAAEDVGPAEALVRSGELFTETWGEQLVGGFSFGLIFVLLALPSIALPYFLGSAFGSTGVVAGAILMIAYWLLLSIVSAAVQGIFNAASIASPPPPRKSRPPSASPTSPPPGNPRDSASRRLYSEREVPQWYNAWHAVPAGSIRSLGHAQESWTRVLIANRV